MSNYSLALLEIDTRTNESNVWLPLVPIEVWFRRHPWLVELGKSAFLVSTSL